ncbi:M55 family metallopeptidase [Sphingosinicella soli]|uniref:D-amino peptidase n=1 Tax=Sphingosinicella soli TaxID=333708 RepID=A0A7W7AY65_9SPHN|nr:M55 family metallopeptidase [Sphingosinicella soli]MBB4630550.1 D-amino peptidase [Sphingosinicella soli]
MRLFISADIEGVAGIVSKDQAGPEGFEYAAARELMTNEVLAVVRGAQAAGVTECVVCDSHGNGLSILADRMPEGTWLVRSWPRPLLMMQGIDVGDYIGAMLIGYHAGAADSAGAMAHTMSSRAIRSLKLNGREADEAFISAATAGRFGVPLLMISGDDVFVEKNAAALGPLEHVTTKRALGTFSAMSPSPKTVAAAARAVAARAKARLFVQDGPIDVELTIVERLSAEVLAFLPMFRRLGSNTVGFRVEDMVELNKALAFLTFFKLS